MSKILTSLHGMLLGLSPANANNKRKLVAPGLVTGYHGNQRTLGGPDTVAYFQDFLGKATLPAEITLLEGTDSATTDAAVVTFGLGGALRMTTGDAGTGVGADAVQIVWERQWWAANGNLCMQARVKLSAITTCLCYIGFTDSLTLEAPFISASSGNTITPQATDAVGFLFDTRMTADTWWLVGIANDVAPTPVNTGLAPVAAIYATFRVELTAAGAASFYYNGVQVGSMTSSVTPSITLTPTIIAAKSSVAASMTCDVDYVEVSMDRNFETTY